MSRFVVGRAHGFRAALALPTIGKTPLCKPLPHWPRGGGGGPLSYLTHACQVEKVDIPTFYPYSPRMSISIPELWANRIFKHFREKSVVEELTTPTIHLDPKDTWAPSGEDFSEAVAWARLLNVTVTKPHGRSGLGDNFILTTPGAVPRIVPICSPTELIDVLRRLASSASNTFIHEAPSPLQPKVRYGRVSIRR